jgi:hypothetical protein
MSPKKPSRFQIAKLWPGFAVLLLLLAGMEIFKVGQGSGRIAFGLSSKWLAFVALYTIMAIGLAAFLFRLQASKKTERSWSSKFIHLRTSFGNAKWLLLAIFVLLPAWFTFFSPLGVLFLGFFTRLILFLVCLFACAWLLSKRAALEFRAVLVGGLLIGAALVLAESLVLVSNYPFALHWSEGNRLWDYSLRFGSDRYNFSGERPIFAWIDNGRQFLWGLPFLIPNLPIWGARLWNAFLTTVPYAILGWVAFVPRKNSALWLLAGIWTMLFLNQGPIYTPLILSAILVAIARKKPLWLALPLVFVAGHYAASSRFTWIFAPGIWAVLLSLGDATIDHRSLDTRDYARAALLGLAGIWSKGLPVLLGIVTSMLPAASPSAIATPSATAVPGTQGIETIQGLQTATGSQPYAWLRLLPNEIYTPGILLGVALACTPLIWLLIYAIRAKIWKTAPWQRLITLLGLLAFFVVGTIASAKVGGGADLHNMDMFLITLILLAGLAWRSGLYKRMAAPEALPKALHVGLTALVLLPAFMPMIKGQPLQLPSAERTEYVLARIREKVDCARNYGEVLFMDQRQLLTFGQMGDLPLVVDYEKKYVMDQALASNKAYFSQFEQDLAGGRFSLIVTEREAILYKSQDDQGIGDSLVEENNAWISWVTVPLFRHYESVANYRDAAIELFMPIERDFDCP